MHHLIGIFMVCSLVTLWSVALWGLYLRGELDALDWAMRMDEWVRAGNHWAPPSYQHDWKHICFYIVPLAVLTPLDLLLLFTGGK